MSLLFRRNCVYRQRCIFSKIQHIFALYNNCGDKIVTTHILPYFFNKRIKYFTI